MLGGALLIGVTHFDKSVWDTLDKSVWDTFDKSVWHTFDKSVWHTFDKSVWDTSDRQPLGTKCVLRPTKAGRGWDGEKPLCDESGGISPQDSDSKQQLQIISRERNSERKDSKEFSAKEVLKWGKNLLKFESSCKHGLVLVKE